jgi:hypothetical protein
MGRQAGRCGCGIKQSAKGISSSTRCGSSFIDKKKKKTTINFLQVVSELFIVHQRKTLTLEEDPTEKRAQECSSSVAFANYGTTAEEAIATDQQSMQRSQVAVCDQL